MEHNLIQSPETISRIQRALGMRQAHIVPTLSDTMHPVVLVHDFTQPNPADEKWAIGTALGTAVAGQNASASIWLPPGSLVRARIVRVTFSFPTLPVAVPEIGILPLLNQAIDPNTGAAVGNKIFEDLKRPSSGIPLASPIAVVSGGTRGGAGTPPYRVAFPDNVTGTPWVWEPRALYIHDSQAIVAELVLPVNQSLRAVFEWIEEPDVAS